MALITLRSLFVPRSMQMALPKVGAVVLSVGLGFLLLQDNLLIALPVVALLGLVLATVVRPDLGTLVAIFVIYCNLAAVAARFHNVPKPLAAAGLLTLFIPPLFNYLIVRREELILDRGFVLILLYLLVLLISTFFAREFKIAAREIAGFLFEGLGLYLVTINVVRRLSVLKRVIWTLLLAGSLMGGLSLWQEVSATQDVNYGGLAQVGGRFSVGRQWGKEVIRLRSAGPIGEKNRYGQIMLVLIPLAFFRYWRERSRARRLCALAAGALILSGMALTFSRTAFLGLILLAALLICMGYLRGRRLILTLGGCAVLLVAAAPGFVKRMQFIPGVTSSQTRQDDSVRNRMAEQWAALHVFLDHPIVGVGPRHFGKHYSTVYVNRSGLVFQDKGYLSHNLYFGIAAEQGILGLIVFLAIVATIGHQLWEVRRRWLAAYPDLAGITTAFLLSLVGYLATAVFLHLSYVRYFWLLLALASAAARCVNQEGEERELLEHVASPSMAPAT